MATKFSGDSWKEEKAAKLTAAREALSQGLAALQTDDDWMRALRITGALGKFSPRRYSFTNQILLAKQNADFRGVAGFESWKKAGRHVKKGARARTVFAPAMFKRQRTQTDPDGNESVVEIGCVTFRPIAVFDYGQTEGDELQAPELPNIEAPEAFERSVESLRDVALALDGRPVSAIRFIEVAPDTAAHGWFDRSTREIVVVTRGRTRADQFKTLAHEVAHAILHGTDEHHSRPVKEIEAESVAFVVSHALGLDTGGYSFPYVASWASHDEEPVEKVVARTGDRIVKAANRILDALVRDIAASETAEGVGECA